MSKRDSAKPADAGRVIHVDTRWVYALLGLLALVAVGIAGLLLGSSGSIGQRLTGRQASPTNVTAAAGTPQPPSNSGARPAAGSVTGATQLPSSASGMVGGAAMPAATKPPGAAATQLAGMFGKMPTTVDGGQMMKAVMKGASPVSPEKVPVGPSEPRLWFTELAADGFELRLGDIPPTGPVLKDVVVENVGTAPLNLMRADGACGCTAVGLKPQVLPPGEKTTIQVKYDPRVSKDAGKQIRKQVWVLSDDPLASVAEFYIVANVLAE